MDPLSHKVKVFKKRRRKKPLSEEIRSVYRLLSVTLILMGVTSTTLILAVNSKQSAMGYTLKELQIQNLELHDDLRNREHLVMLAQSLTQIEQNDLIKNMTNPDLVAYIDSSGNLAQSSD
jgi:hypothetical protein